jgi:2-keto-3-deoxy-L-rhamnonate aldolase RhmA
MNSFRTLLERDDAPLGTWVKLPTVETLELMFLAGFDFVVIDLEHSAMSLETMSSLLAVAKARRSAALVRVPDHAPAWTQRALDAGAAGVLVPHVDNLDQAVAVRRSARFEPQGIRGVGPTSRAGDWGLRPMSEYLAEGNETVVVAQIESERGVQSAEQMLTAGVVDALFVGPADLSVAVGAAADSDIMKAHIDTVLQASLKTKVPCGIAIGADPAKAAALAADGFSFVMVSNDATILGSGAAQLVQRYRGA